MINRKSAAILSMAMSAMVILPGGSLADPGEASAAYREAFAMAGALPRDAEEFVSTATRETVGQLEEALDLVRQAARADSVDWGTDWKLEGFDAIDYEMPGQVRNMARLGVTYHKEKLKRGEYERFAEDMAALLRMGHHFSEGQVLIPYLTAIATEGIVRATVLEHVPDLPEEVREDLLQRMQGLPAGPSLAEVFEVERAAMRGQLWNVFAGTAEMGEGAPEKLFDGERLDERLRASSIVVIEDEVWGVGFEDAETGEAFSLRPGENRGDLTLVSVDPQADRALVRRAGEAAVIELSDRRLLPFDPETGWTRVEYFAGQLARTIQFWREEEYEADLGHLLEEAAGDPLSAFEALLELYEREMDAIAPIATMAHDELPSREEAWTGMSIFGHATAPTLVSVRSTEMRNQAEQELLVAGLAFLHESDFPLPVSEVTGDPIRAYEQDGRLILESTLPDPRPRQEGPVRVEFVLN